MVLWISLELELQVGGGHLTWVLGTEHVSLGRTGYAINGSGLYAACSFCFEVGPFWL